MKGLFRKVSNILKINGAIISGDNINIVGGNVFVDGKRVEVDTASGRLEVVVVEGVIGELRADGNVTCGAVSGSVDAGGNVTCSSVQGHVDAGGNVTCENVGGDVDAGGSVRCGKVAGRVDAGGSVVIT